MPAPDGFIAEIFEGPYFSGPAVQTRRLEDLFFVFQSDFPEGYPEGTWSLRARGRLLPDGSGRRRLVLANSSPTRVYLDGDLVLDGTERTPVDLAAYHSWLANDDLAVEVELTGGEAVELVVEYVHSEAPVGAFRVGVRETDEDALMERAVAAAGEAQVAVVFVGTSHEYESEGFDRRSFSLPRRQDELARRVAAVNARTVVVVNSGAPVDLPWAEEVAAVVQVWFGGQEMDWAVADVLTGRAEPGGRLPTTIPRRIEHIPSYDNFPGENSEIRYGEGLFMGYRGYEHRAIEPRFAFGHGLSYTTIELGAPELSATTFRPGERLSISVPVTNVGSRPGSEVVQCYVAPRSPRLTRPVKELKGFAKVHLDPGETAIADTVLEDRSFAYWDNGQPDWDEMKARVRSAIELPPSARQSTRGWQVDPGDYDVLIGVSSDRILFRTTITVPAAGTA